MLLDYSLFSKLESERKKSHLKMLKSIIFLLFVFHTIIVHSIWRTHISHIRQWKEREMVYELYFLFSLISYLEQNKEVVSFLHTLPST